MWWLLFLATVFAQTVWDDVQSGVMDVVNSVGVVPITILTLTLIIAVAYMFGSAFNNERVVFWAKEELYHLLFSIFLMLFFVSFLQFFNAVFQYFLNTPSSVCYHTSPQKTVLCELDVMLKDLHYIPTLLTKYSIKYQRDAAAYVSYFGWKKGTTFTPYGYKGAWAAMLDMLSYQYVFAAYVALSAQHLFFQYVVGDGSGTSTLLLILLPAAIIARFFPFLRDGGNFLFATAIGLYTLMPALFAVVYSSASTDYCSDVADVVSDPIPVLDTCSSSTSLYAITKYYPYAFLYPNFVLGIVATFIYSFYKVLKGYG